MPALPNTSDHGLLQVAISDIGRRRPVNQDSHAERLESNKSWPLRGHLFIVADGMGAHAAGELASQQAVYEIVRHYQPSESMPARDALVHAIEKANASIFRRGREDPELYNMGTTCSTLLLLPEGAIVAHVGDSRVYRCRGQRIQQLTFDHSLVWEMRAAGQLGRHDERNSIVPRNVITRCLGPHPDVQVDLEGPFSVQLGDLFLLCSDGLTGRISDAEIGTILTSLPPNESAAFLVDLANLRGGTDNITVVVIKVTGDCICTPTDRDPVSPVGEKSTASNAPAHPAWWAALIAALSAALVSVAMGHLPLGIIFAAAAAASVLALALPIWRNRTPVTLPSLGEAPYETATCQVDRTFVKGLLGTFDVALDDLTQSQDGIAELKAELGEMQGQHLERESQSCQRLAQFAGRLAEVVRKEPQSLSDSSFR